MTVTAAPAGVARERQGWGQAAVGRSTSCAMCRSGCDLDGRGAWVAGARCPDHNHGLGQPKAGTPRMYRPSPRREGRGHTNLHPCSPFKLASRVLMHCRSVPSAFTGMLDLSSPGYRRPVPACPHTRTFSPGPTVQTVNGPGAARASSDSRGLRMQESSSDIMVCENIERSVC